MFEKLPKYGYSSNEDSVYSLVQMLITNSERGVSFHDRRWSFLQLSVNGDMLLRAWLKITHSEQTVKTVVQRKVFENESRTSLLCGLSQSAN